MRRKHTTDQSIGLTLRGYQEVWFPELAFTPARVPVPVLDNKQRMRTIPNLFPKDDLSTPINEDFTLKTIMLNLQKETSPSMMVYYSGV